MIKPAEEPNTFLWVLRGLTSAFLLGYILYIFLAVLLYETFPVGNPLEDILAIGLLILFGLGYYLLWLRKEILAGLIFILWYAALWPLEILTGGNNFEESQAPGIIMLILGILLLVYRTGVRRRLRASTRSGTAVNEKPDQSGDQISG